MFVYLSTHLPHQDPHELWEQCKAVMKEVTTEALKKGIIEHLSNIKAIGLTTQRGKIESSPPTSKSIQKGPL